MNIKQKVQVEKLKSEGYSFQKISDEMNISVGTIKSYFSRKDTHQKCNCCRYDSRRPMQSDLVCIQCRQNDVGSAVVIMADILPSLGVCFYDCLDFLTRRSSVPLVEQVDDWHHVKCRKVKRLKY
ncbi:MAG: hypothetical protein ACI4JM_11870 [Oscillospiraceae bacterium]